MLDPLPRRARTRLGAWQEMLGAPIARATPSLRYSALFRQHDIQDTYMCSARMMRSRGTAQASQGGGSSISRSEFCGHAMRSTTIRPLPASTRALAPQLTARNVLIHV